MKKLTVGSCFSGIGGLELGLEWTGGFETVWQVENDAYASAVLAKHWPGVKRFSDIRDVVRPGRVDVICGGFPCQDVSLAGTRVGLEGKRSTLWGEMHRLICEVKPRWVVAENVPGLFSSDDGRFFGNVLRDLALAGYDAEWGVLSAAGMGAPHLRRRVFILGHPHLHGRNGSEDGCGDHSRDNGDPEGQNEFRQPSRSGGSRKEDVADSAIVRGEIRARQSRAPGKMADAKGDSGRIRNRNSEKNVSDSTHDGAGRRQQQSKGRKGSRDVANAAEYRRIGWFPRSGEEKSWWTHPEAQGRSWWDAEPNVGRVANGISSRDDRLRCLGNAVVPQVAQKIGEMILKFEQTAATT